MPRGWKGQPNFPVAGVIGIDPGRSSGGIAYVTHNYARAWKMPETDRDIWSLVSRLSDVAQLAVIEKVNAMPKQGVSSTFKFGTSFGELKMALVAARVRYVLETPSKWQGSMKCRTKGDKNVTKSRAQQLWPNLRITHALADALLIAEYGRCFLCVGSSG